MLRYSDLVRIQSEIKRLEIRERLDSKLCLLGSCK